MDFTQAIRSCFSNYITFQGRASRSEFWYFALFATVGGFVIGVLESLTFGLSLVGTGFLRSLFSLAVFVPLLAVEVRRLHDLDRSGWWWWLSVIPIVGWIILLFWWASKGTDGDNNYGHDPLGGWADSDETSYVHKSSTPKVNRDD